MHTQLCIAIAALAPLGAVEAQDAPRLVERARIYPGSGAVEGSLFPDGGAPVDQLAFSPTDAAFATASGASVALWDDAAQPCARFDLLLYVDGLAFDPRGRYLVATGGSVTVWDRERERAAIELPQCYGPAAWSPDGRYLVVKSRLGAALVLERETFRDVGWRALEPARGELEAVLWDRRSDGLWIAAGRTFARFDVAQQAIENGSLRQLPERSQGICALGILKGSLIAFGRRHEVVLQGERRLRLPLPVRVACSEGGMRCVFARPGSRELFELGDEAPIRHDAPCVVSSIAFDARGRLAVGGTDGRVHLDVLGSGRARSFDGRLGSPVTSLAFTPDERFALASGIRVAILELATCEVREIPRAGALTSGRGGAEALIAGRDAIEAWNCALASRTRAWPYPPSRLNNPSSPDPLSLSPDHRTLFVGPGWLGSVARGLDLESGDWRDLERLVGVRDIQWSRDGAIALAVRGDSSCVSFAFQPSRMRFYAMASGASFDRAFSPYASGAFFLGPETDLVWSELPAHSQAQGGVYRRRSPEGRAEQLSTAAYDHSRRVGEDLFLGARGVHIDLCFIADGRRVHHLVLGDLWYGNAGVDDVAVSASGHWVMLGTGNEARVYEVVR